MNKRGWPRLAARARASSRGRRFRVGRRGSERAFHRYSGFFKLDAANIKKAARSTLKTLKLKDELLEKLGLPDGADAADVKKKLADLAENQWEANEHRALGGLAGFAAAVFYL